MRIAFINNMNNAFFSMARYLRDVGVSAHLYTIPASDDHFMPESDTFEDVKSLDWVHVCPFGGAPKEFLFTRRGGLEQFEKYDVLVGSGTSPAFFLKKGRALDVIIPYGADLYEYPFMRWTASQPFVSAAKAWLALWQRRAFSKAKYILNNDFIHPLYSQAINRLGVESLRLPVPVVYNKEKKESSHWDYLDEHDFVVFNHSRQLWVSNPDSLADFDQFGGEKRNDRVIRGFADFVAGTRYKSPLLVMFEYGPDVEESKRLVASCGIEKYVRWEPLSPRKLIMEGLRKADFATNQFREGVCGLGCTAMEALASGTPLLTHLGPEAGMAQLFKASAPIVDALKAKEISAVFFDFEKDPAKYRDIGKRSEEWFDSNLGAGVVDLYIGLFEDVLRLKSLQ